MKKKRFCPGNPCRPFPHPAPVPRISNYKAYFIWETFMDEKRTVVALAGNPNVGKSTIFNGLTGLRQHTG